MANPQVGIREYLQKRDSSEKERLNAEAHAWCVSKGIARREGESVTDWLHRTGVLKKLSALTR